MVRRGTHTGVVQFVTDPNMGYGTVCKIGDYWFYFGGGITAEELEPDEYVKHFPSPRMNTGTTLQFSREVDAKNRLGVGQDLGLTNCFCQK